MALSCLFAFCELYCTLSFFVLLIWKTIGAPLTAQQWQDLETPLWQARTLLPSRMAQICRLWAFMSVERPENATLLRNNPEETTAQAATIRVYDAAQNKLVSMPLEEYVCAVVACEMPASYHIEALKAQAIAARTRAVYQMKTGCSQHPEADICTQSDHCQGYTDAAACKAKWGECYEAYRARIEEAVQATAGELLTYEGQPIVVMYHAVSGGQTEDVKAVFSESLPYLVSVESDGEDNVNGCYVDTSFSFEEATALLCQAFPQCALTADNLAQQLTICTHTESGRVDRLMLGTTEIKATELRKALGLRSTWFTISMSDNTITFHQRGYGHGVGMSQAGANIMASEGKGYQTILQHYYPGTELTYSQATAATISSGRNDDAARNSN